MKTFILGSTLTNQTEWIYFLTGSEKPVFRTLKNTALIADSKNTNIKFNNISADSADSDFLRFKSNKDPFANDADSDGLPDDIENEAGGDPNTDNSLFIQAIINSFVG